jgi:hypothetical protein
MMPDAVLTVVLLLALALALVFDLAAGWYFGRKSREIYRLPGERK